MVRAQNITKFREEIFIVVTPKRHTDKMPEEFAVEAVIILIILINRNGHDIRRGMLFQKLFDQNWTSCSGKLPKLDGEHNNGRLKSSLFPDS